MKKSELREIIREEMQSLNEVQDNDYDEFIKDTQSEIKILQDALKKMKLFKSKKQVPDKKFLKTLADTAKRLGWAAEDWANVESSGK